MCDGYTLFAFFCGYTTITGDGKFLTDSVIENPGLPGCVAIQSIFYQLDTTTQ